MGYYFLTSRGTDFLNAREGKELYGFNQHCILDLPFLEAYHRGTKP
jgi:hypothetical protein